MAPICWLMGIPWAQAVTAGGLMGIKTILNELVAYLQLAALPADALDPRSRLIMLYAMCGFANFGSLGIMIAGLATMCAGTPRRRGLARVEIDRLRHADDVPARRHRRGVELIRARPLPQGERARGPRREVSLTIGGQTRSCSPERAFEVWGDCIWSVPRKIFSPASFSALPSRSPRCLLQLVETRVAGQPYLEALVLAILLGVAVRTAWKPGPRWTPGISFCAKFVLEFAIVMLGAAVSVTTIMALGPA